MKLIAAHFLQSVSLVNERQSVAIGAHGCKDIKPARLMADGSAQPIDKEQASGLLVTESGPRGELRQVYVPMHNVRFLQYGDEAKAAK